MAAIRGLMPSLDRGQRTAMKLAMAAEVVPNLATKPTMSLSSIASPLNTQLNPAGSLGESRSGVHTSRPPASPAESEARARCYDAARADRGNPGGQYLAFEMAQRRQSARSQRTLRPPPWTLSTPRAARPAG